VETSNDAAVFALRGQVLGLGQMLLLQVTLTSNGEVLQVFHEISTRYGT